MFNNQFGKKNGTVDNDIFKKIGLRPKCDQLVSWLGKEIDVKWEKYSQTSPGTKKLQQKLQEIFILKVPQPNRNSGKVKKTFAN